MATPGSKRRWARSRGAIALFSALFVLGLMAATAFADDLPLVSTTSETTATADPTSSDASAAGATSTGDATTNDAVPAESCAPSIRSQYVDYSPGESVVLEGACWPAGDRVKITTNDDAGQTWSDTGYADVAADGTITYGFTLPSWFVAVYSVTASGDPSGATATTTFTDGPLTGVLQGQSNPTCSVADSHCAPPWQDNNLTGWAELQTVPMRLYFPAGQAGNTKTFTISIDHASGATAGLEGLTNLTPSGTNVTMGAVAFTQTQGGDIWNYQFSATVNDGNEAYISFNTRLRAGAHNFGGASLQMKGAGTISFVKPGAAPGSPDLTLSKTGLTAASPGQTLTYTLSYRNVATGSNSATGVQLTDTLPANVTYVAGSCTGCTYDSVSNTLTWNLGTIAAGSPLSAKTFQVTVGSAVTNNTAITNTAQILSAENDASSGNNTSALVTTIFVPSISGTVLSDDNGDGVENDGGAGVAGASISLFRDGNSNGTLDPPATDPQVGSAITTPASGEWAFTSGLARSTTYFVVETNPSGYTSTQAVPGTGSNSTAAKVTNDQIKVVLANQANTYTSNNKFLAKPAPTNQAPTANAQSVTTNEDTAKTITLTGSDPDGNALTYRITSLPTSGALYNGLSAVGSAISSVPFTLTGADVTFVPNANYSGADNFQFKVDDGTVDSASAIVSITVNAVNDAPVAVADAYSVGEDGTLTETAPGVLGNDSDVDGNSLTADLVSGPSHGTLALNADGSFMYTPNANFNGTDSFVYRAFDGTAYSSSATVTISVTSTNDAPAAVNDSYSTDEETALSVAAPGVLGNDSDAENDVLTAVVVSGPSHGSLTLNADGSFTYTPAANFNGSDSFTYKASDGSADSNVATVSLTVNAVNDAPVAADDAYSTAEDTPLSVAAPGVLGNDVDGDGDSLSVVLVGGPAHGSLTLNADGSFSYLPYLDYNGPDSFTYKANDGTADSNVATVSLTVNAVNDAPAAVNDAYSTDEDTSLNVAAPGLLGNDTDVDGNGLSAVLVGGPSHGSLTLNADGSFTYTPAANFNGSDSFTYKASDGSADSNVATVSLTVNAVNDAPVGADDAYTTNEDVQLNVAAPGVLANDTDADSDALSAVLVSGPSHGTLALNGNGSFGYTPASNFNGSDSFTYKANDGTADSNAATVNLTVNAVNDAPVAVNDAFTTDEDTPLSVPVLSGVLTNDTDIDSVLLTAVLVSGPAHGSLTANADGSFSYTPDANYNGPDSFTYKANDGALDSNVATVAITIRPVNDAPVAAHNAYSTNEDTQLTVIAPGVLANDSDVENDSLSTILVSGPSHGSLTLDANGGFVYAPAVNYNGPDSFTYKANDGTLDSNTATVSLTINPVNDAPVAVADSFATDEDTPLNVTAPGVLGNDTDVESSALTAVLVSSPTHGTLSPSADGSFSYAPDANYSGPDSFTYKANDGALDSNVATVSLTVNSINDAPVAAGNAYTTDEDTPLNVAAPGVVGNDSDVDGDALTAVLASGPAHGTLTLNANGSFGYTPASNFNGSDSFTYKANDGTADSNVATVNLTVNPVNDKPAGAANPSSITMNEDGPAESVSVSGSDVETGAANLKFTITQAPAHGDLKNGSTVLSTGDQFTGSPKSLSYDSAQDYNGSDSFKFKVTDTGDGSSAARDSDEVTVGITINPVNDAPSAAANPTSITMNEDAPAESVSVSGSDVETGAANLKFTITQAPAHGDLKNGSTVLSTGDQFTGSPKSLGYDSAQDYNGSDSFKFKVTDTGDGSAAALDSDVVTVAITINPVNDQPTAASDAASRAVQYSDAIAAVGFTGQDVDNAASTLTASTQYNVGGGSFSNGLPNGLNLVAGSTAGTWTLQGKALVAPGTYVVRVSVSDGVLSSTPAETTITVAQEDARSYYTGGSLFFGSSTSATTAMATLAATIKDITAVTADSAYDADAGNITNARVTFEITTDSNQPVASASCSNLTPSLVSIADEKVGTVSCQQSLSIGASSASNYTVKVKVNGYYVDTSNEIATIIVAQPLGTNFITGGGYLVNPTNTAGSYAGDANRKTNFGFNVKYNKSGTNLQGNINMIVRKGAKLYQFKSNSLSSLGVQYCKASNGVITACAGGPTAPCTTNASATCPITASFQGKANLNDVTGSTPVSLGGNLTLQMALTDRGEPGSADSLAITVYNGNTLLFSSQWDGTKTVEKILSGGNLVAH